MNISIKTMIDALKRLEKLRRRNNKPAILKVPCALLILEADDMADWNEFQALKGKEVEQG